MNFHDSLDWVLQKPSSRTTFMKLLHIVRSRNRTYPMQRAFSASTSVSSSVCRCVSALSSTSTSPMSSASSSHSSLLPSQQPFPARRNSCSLRPPPAAWQTMNKWRTLPKSMRGFSSTSCALAERVLCIYTLIPAMHACWTCSCTTWRQGSAGTWDRVSPFHSQLYTRKLRRHPDKPFFNSIKVLFKNSKGETLKEVEANEGDDIVDLSWEHDLDIEGVDVTFFSNALKAEQFRNDNAKKPLVRNR